MATVEDDRISFFRSAEGCGRAGAGMISPVRLPVSPPVRAVDRGGFEPPFPGGRGQRPELADRTHRAHAGVQGRCPGRGGEPLVAAAPSGRITRGPLDGRIPPRVCVDMCAERTRRRWLPRKAGTEHSFGRFTLRNAGSTARGGRETAGQKRRRPPRVNPRRPSQTLGAVGLRAADYRAGCALRPRALTSEKQVGYIEFMAASLPSQSGKSTEKMARASDAQRHRGCKAAQGTVSMAGG